MDPKKLTRAVSLHGKFSIQKNFQEMLQHAGRVGIYLRQVLRIEAKQAAVESVASAADAAVHTCAETIGQIRSPIANHHRIS
jgi:hypothetical protein